MEIQYSKSAKKAIEKYDKPTKQRIKEGIVRAWDPDFTKVTPDEAKAIEQAEREFKNGEVYSHDEVWA